MNPIAPLAKIVLVGDRTRDPALADDMDIKAYEERRDPALIKLKPGMTPTYFFVQQPTRKFLATQIDTLSHWSEQFLLAFNAYCHRVEQPGKQALTPGDDGWESERGAVPRIANDSWMAQLDEDFHMQAIYEVGAFAIKRARVSAKSQTPLPSAPTSEATVSSGQSESAPDAAAK